MPTHQPITDLTFTCHICSATVTEPRRRRRVKGVSCQMCKATTRKRQYWANPELARQKTRQWRLDNPEKAAIVAEKIKKYLFDHRDERREYKKIHAHLRRSKYVGKFTNEDVQRIYTRQRGKCANPTCACVLRRKFHIDHIMPIAKGGPNTTDNLQLLCPSCNHRKSAKDPYVWAQENGRLFV